MNRELLRRLRKLEARHSKDDLSHLSDAALIERTEAAEVRLKATLGSDWKAEYRDYLAEIEPHLLAAWDALHRADPTTLSRLQ